MQLFTWAPASAPVIAARALQVSTSACRLGGLQ